MSAMVGVMEAMCECPWAWCLVVSVMGCVVVRCAIASWFRTRVHGKRLTACLCTSSDNFFFLSTHVSTTTSPGGLVANLLPEPIYVVSSLGIQNDISQNKR